MAIDWNDIFRGLGASAQYLSAYMREKRLMKEEEEAQMRIFKKQKTFEARLQEIAQKKYQDFQKELLQLRQQAEEEASKKQLELQTQVDLLGSVSAADRLNRAIGTRDPLQLARVQAETALIAKIRGGATPEDLTEDELKIFSGLDPVQQAMFSGVMNKQRQLNMQMENAAKQLDGQLALIGAQIENFKSLAEMRRLNPYGLTPDDILKRKLAAEQALAKIIQDPNYRQVEDLLARGKKLEDLPLPLQRQYKVSKAAIQTTLALIGQYKLMSGESPIQAAAEEEAPPTKPEKGEASTLSIAIGKPLSRAGAKVAKEITKPFRAELKTERGKREANIARAEKVILPRARKDFGDVMSYSDFTALRRTNPEGTVGKKFLAPSKTKKNRMAVYQVIRGEGGKLAVEELKVY